jgi:ornithine cyclodeaminase/alanine dehydrogenase-like protein (mu-crystallin family)
VIRDKKGRAANDKTSITFADLTGVAVQDVVISGMVLDALRK